MLLDIFGILTLISFGLTAWRWALHRRFPLHRRSELVPDPPGVTILKPLKNQDDNTRACLKSWFEQDYKGPTQLLFGVASPLDPVCALVRELISEFKNVDAQLVICAEKLGANNKVSKLRQLEPLIKYPILIISDADVLAPRDFAAQVAPLCRDDVGLVNCFYRLANPATAAMRWEAVAINADFWTNVLQAASFTKLDFALGAVMTLPLSALKAIGGFAVLSDYLADDYQLGNKIAASGRRIILGTLTVDCWDPVVSWGAVWRHQLRWARTIRACQRVPFVLSVINNSTIWPLILLALSFPGVVWGMVIGVGALTFRILAAQQQQARLTQERFRLGWWWLVPVKDLLDFAIWLASFWGSEIEWRGERYRISAGAKLVKV